MNKITFPGLGVLLLIAVSAHSQTLTPNQLYGTECDDGFFKLFNGTRADFNTEWVNYVQNQTTTTALNAGWSLDANTSSITKTATPNDIRSVKQFANFDWRLQFKTNGNSGLYYRGTLAYSTAWASGVEVGIDNDVTVKNSWRSGANYDLYEPVPDAAQVYIPYGAAATAGWNEIRIIAIGDSVEHWLNGIRVVKYRYFSADYNTRYAGSKWNAAKQMGYAVAGNQSAGPILRGYLGFQGDHQGVFFARNIRIDTTPSWTSTYQWPPTPNAVCTGASSVLSAGAEGAARLVSLGGGLAVSLPGREVRDAVLLDVFGRVQARAQSDGKGGATFAEHPENGVYFLRYASGNKNYGVRVSLVSSD